MNVGILSGSDRHTRHPGGSDPGSGDHGSADIAHDPNKERCVMTDATYGITRNLGKVAFEEAIRRTTEALKTEGFGVLTEIDVKATLKKKLDVDFRNYKILGACNPPLAHKALSSELLIGLLLPCNVVVAEEDDGTTSVSLIKPSSMFSVVESPGLAEIAAEVDAKLQRIADAI